MTYVDLSLVQKRRLKTEASNNAASAIVTRVLDAGTVEFGSVILCWGLSCALQDI